MGEGETIPLEWAPLSDDELRALAKRWNAPGGDKQADVSYEMTQRIRATAASVVWLRAERTRLLLKPAPEPVDGTAAIIAIADGRLGEILQVLTGWRRSEFHMSQSVLVDDVFQAVRGALQRDWSWEGLTNDGRAELVSAVQLAFERGVRATIEVCRSAVRGKPVPDPYRVGLPR
jgi:hypothetical protein